MSLLEQIEPYWEIITAAGTVLGPVLTAFTIGCVLVTKKDSTSAVAWCLFVFFLPLFGPLFFLLFGYQHVNRPLKRKRAHKLRFQSRYPGLRPAFSPELPASSSRAPDEQWEGLERLARRFGATPKTSGNDIAFFHEGKPAFEAMLDAIRSAKHHVHLETFIFQPDATGRRFLDALAERARAGVQVRLLFDAVGSRKLRSSMLRHLQEAGGRCSVFLPISPFRRRLQINLRNHRKILVVDGEVAFVGGLNIGDEYLGLDPRFGFWRDTHLRLRGPAVAGLQGVFIEDWDFAAAENLEDPAYFPTPQSAGALSVQIIDSGPDREAKGIRETYFAGILQAKKRLWIASPYFVPDAGLLDALCLAGHLGVDVRLLCQFHPDKWIPYFAARYYFGQVLAAGVKVYQYTKGMLHSKVVMADGQWASVGTANLDNRSMHLNFEVNCLVYTPAAVAELETAFLNDLESAIRLDRDVYARRPLAGRLLDNACRLFSPIM